MADDGMEFWLFDGLEEEAYGLLPLQNITSKGGPTGTKQLKRVGSYNWDLSEQDEPTIVVPGDPREYIFWNGGRLSNDRGVLVYDVNRLKLPAGPMDPMVLVPKLLSEPSESNPKPEPFDFKQIDIVTDALNLQKLFAFCRNEGEGLFRIDCERVGKLLVMTRVEASELMTIDYETFDQALKRQTARPKSKLTEGPFFSLATYQFGDFRLLVRQEADAADFSAEDPMKNSTSTAAESAEANGPITEKMKPTENPNLTVIRKGTGGLITDVKAAKKQRQAAAGSSSSQSPPLTGVPLMTMTSYPQGGGFPYFVWAQLVFSGVDQCTVGWYKPPNDFARPAQYSLTDVTRLMKPLPLPALAKVHDCLGKIYRFMNHNAETLKIALIWKGADSMEIFNKLPDTPGGLSPGVRQYLSDVLAEDQLATVPELDAVD